ncbi:UNVERIFIED_ORG: hypothetical protein FHR35_009117 [Microbispora rosea subsp. rosea]
MAEYDFPAELVEAQRAFLDAEAKLAELNALFPPPTAIAAGETSVPEGLRRAHDEVWAKQSRALDVLYGHERWKTIPREERFEARMQLRRAARGG